MEGLGQFHSVLWTALRSSRKLDCQPCCAEQTGRPGRRRGSTIRLHSRAQTRYQQFTTTVWFQLESADSNGWADRKVHRWQQVRVAWRLFPDERLWVHQ